MIMSEITVVAKIVARPDSVERLKAELFKLVVPTRLEKGCLKYDLHQDNQEPALFIFYEIWESAQCLEKHINSEHYKAYARAAADLIRDKAVHIMTRIA